MCFSSPLLRNYMYTYSTLYIYIHLYVCIYIYTYMYIGYFFYVGCIFLGEGIGTYHPYHILSYSDCQSTAFVLCILTLPLCTTMSALHISVFRQGRPLPANLFEIYATIRSQQHRTLTQNKYIPMDHKMVSRVFFLFSSTCHQLIDNNIVISSFI